MPEFVRLGTGGQSRAGVKVHTSLDLRGNIPSFIRITGARESDASFLDHLPLEAGSFYVMDSAYVHFARLIRFTHAAAFFVVRSKEKLHYRVVHCEAARRGCQHTARRSRRIDRQVHQGRLSGALRRIEVLDAQEQRTFFPDQQLRAPALQIAQLYKCRWQVELFFKWIKQHLRIKAFVGNSANAVKTQMWIAICTYVMVAIIKKQLNAQASLHAILQVLSVICSKKHP